MSAIAQFRSLLSASALRLRSPLTRTVGTTRSFSSTPAARAEEQGGKHVPFGELGSGYYSDNTKGCYDVIANATPMMLEACTAVLDARNKRGAAEKEEPFVISDFGAADAGTSLPMMHKLVEHIRKREPNTHVVLSYEDQPMNDWTSVFRRLQGEIASDPGLDHHHGGSLPCILDRFEGVTIAATGVSFYNPCFPPKSIDLMFSATAMHWFRKSPMAMEKVLHSAMLEKTDKEFQTYWDMAAVDWKIILKERAKELKPGGRFGCVSFAKNEQGHFLGHSAHVGQSMHHQFRDIWADMASAGRITKAEFEATNFPNQYRCMEEYLAPFGGDGGPATGVSAAILAHGVKGKAAFEGLSVAAASYGEVRCPYHERWLREKTLRKEKGVDEAAAAKEHAKRFVPTTRTWSNSTFESGLNASRSTQERQERSNELFATYEARVAADPENHAMDYQHVYLVMNKD